MQKPLISRLLITDRYLQSMLMASTGILLVLVFAFSINPRSATIFWLVGISFGIVVQRSRFCFTAAFRDFFLFGQTRMLKGVLLGLGICTIGFVMIMSTVSPNPGFGSPPSDLNILPVGISTLIAGMLFGVGMVLAGGCVSGSLYRMGEGYVGSWIAIIGVIVGLFLLNNTWNWWWDTFISQEAKVWLPSQITYTGALIVTAFGLLSILYLAVWRERQVTRGFVMPKVQTKNDEQLPNTVTDEITGYLKRMFRSEWSPLVGGSALAALNILLFIRFHPLGVVGEINRWSTSFTQIIGLPEITLKGMDTLGACALVISEGSWFTDGFFLNFGIIAGSATSAIVSREFKLRIPRSPKRYVQSLCGGVIMGYGAGLGLGCTLGAFFSAVPSLALNGWVYAIGLSLGAFLGVQLIKRFS